MSATGNPGVRADAGFTLLEMLVAVAIMALITGIAFPALERQVVPSAQMSARGDVTLALIEARGDAIGQGSPTRLSLTPPGILRFSSGRPAIALPQGVSLVWPEGGYVFYPDGSATGGQGEIHTRAQVSRFGVTHGTGQPDFAR